MVERKRARSRRGFDDPSVGDTDLLEDEGAAGHDERPHADHDAGLQPERRCEGR